MEQGEALGDLAWRLVRRLEPGEDGVVGITRSRVTLGDLLRVDMRAWRIAGASSQADERPGVLPQQCGVTEVPRQLQAHEAVHRLCVQRRILQSLRAASVNQRAAVQLEGGRAPRVECEIDRFDLASPANVTGAAKVVEAASIFEGADVIAAG